MSLLAWHTDPEEDGMHDHHVYKVVELVGSSPNSIEDAIKPAIARANATSGTSDGSRWWKPEVTSKMERFTTIR